MYIVEITNGSKTTQIHGKKVKLSSGKINKGINTIDSFTFSMFPDNPGFTLINEFTTHVTVYNTNKDRYDFIGRALYAETTMAESGLITKNVTCESLFGYLCDSWQEYTDTQNWTVAGILQHLIDCHNSQVEEYKQFKVGTVTATDSNDNLYQAVQRENTWDSIKSKLLDKIGGELQFRVEDDGIYIDYLEQIGEAKQTEIALSKNMKAITKEQDPTAYVTRLIPLGCKLTDEEGNETEHRLDITSIQSGGVNYIDDEDAIALYGIHVKVVEWDDVTTVTALFSKGQNWMKQNNRVQVKYTVTALDLSLIGLAVDDFDVGNTHPVVNGLIGIDDVARIIKKTIDICEEIKSSFEVGDNIKTLSDIQRDQTAEIKAASQGVQKLQTSQKNLSVEYVQALETQKEEITKAYQTEIQQLSDSIKLEVSGSLGSNASIILSAGANKYSYEMDMTQVRTAFANDETAISISAGLITFNAGTLVINSTNFTLDSEGTITANAGTVGGWTLKNYKLYAGDGVDIKTVCVQAPTANNLYVFAAGGTSHDSYADCPFRVTKAGKLYATDAIVYGDIITIDGSFKTEMDKGSIRLYYSDVLCGTINTKYWSGASTEGISLRIEEGGNYIMFSHPSDSASGYDVDYYLNYGWSTNYDEKHIFQTSARFLDDVIFQGKAKFYGAYILDGYFIKSISSDGTVGEEMLGYSSSRVNVGSVGCPTMLRGTTVYLKNTSTTVTSDRNQKNSIEELPEAYETFIDALAPVRFKYNEGNSGRYHVGYIAQDVEAALTSAGLSTTDFAGYVDIEGSGELGLAYDEFIALLHKKIKRLESRISELESVNT